MRRSRKTPKWLIFVDRDPDDGPWLRLMVLNPVNDQPSPVLNVVIDTDPPLIHPGPRELHTHARAEVQGVNGLMRDAAAES